MISPLIAQTPTGAGIGLLHSILGQGYGVDATPAADPILAAVAANNVRQKETIQPVQKETAQTVSAGTGTGTGVGNINANTVTSGNAANPILAATTPATPGTSQWNNLGVGQVVNGGKVLDANVFNSDILSKFGGASDNVQGAQGATMFQVNGKNDPTFGKALGNNLGSNGLVKLLGFQQQDFSGFQQASGGESRTDASYNWDSTKLLAAAKAAGVDTSGYKAPDNTQAYDKASQDLQNQVNAANFKKASSDPNAIFQIDSQRVGDEKGQHARNLTYYVQRGDRLIPVKSQDYTQDSDLKDTWKGVAPLLAIVASAFLGPEIAAAFGGGIGGGVAAGATLGGIQSGLSGGNILKGAALGAVGGGVSAGVSGLAGGGDIGKILGGAAGAGVKTLAGGGGGSDALTSAILGGVGGATGAIGSSLGIDPAANGFLGALLKQGTGTILHGGKP